MLTFIYIARGSSGEVRSMLRLLEAFPLFAKLKPELQAAWRLGDLLAKFRYQGSAVFD